LKVWLSLIIAVAALVIAVRDQNEATGQPTPWEEGAHQVDSYLQEGLSRSTHNAISKGASEYAGWADGLKNDLNGAVDY
jgi:hypothetical protein